MEEKLKKMEIGTLFKWLERKYLHIVGRKGQVKSVPRDEDALAYTMPGDKVFLNERHPGVTSVILLIGLFVHECMHQVYTAFQESQRTGQLYKGAERSQFHSFANICEDPAIERAASKTVGGFLLKCLYQAIKHFSDNAVPLQDCEHPYEQLLDALIMFGDTGRLKGYFTYPEAYEMYVKLRPLFLQNIIEPNGKKRVKLQKLMFDATKDLREDYTPSENAPKGHSSPSLGDGDGQESPMSQKEKQRLKDMLENLSKEEVEAMLDENGTPISLDREDIEPTGKKKTSKNTSDDESGEDGADNEEGSGSSGDGSDETNEEEGSGSSGDSSEEADEEEDAGSSSSGSDGADNEEDTGSSEAASDGAGDDFAGDNSDNSSDEGENGDGASDESSEDGTANNAEQDGMTCPNMGHVATGEAQGIGEEFWSDAEISEEDVDKICQEIVEISQIDASREGVYVPKDYPITSANLEGVSCNNEVIDMEQVTDRLQERYETIVDQMYEGIEYIYEELLKQFKAERSVKFKAKSGKLNVMRYYSPKITPRIFDKNTDPGDKSDCCVMFVVDQSGSMSGAKMEVTRAAVIMAVEALSKLGIPCYVMGFTTEGGYVSKHLHYVWWELEEEARIPLVCMNARGGNIDSYATRYAHELLNERHEKHKLLITIHDGLPSVAYGSFEDAIGDCAKSVEEIREDDIYTLGIGVGVPENDIPQFEAIYGEDFTLVNQVNEFPEELCTLINDTVETW
ncbi:MAG: hypothetical protein K6G62_00720 [Eubacterium sp.]|nr:hypothetical protein [Eubacterium sp.]